MPVSNLHYTLLVKRQEPCLYFVANQANSTIGIKVSGSPTVRNVQYKINNGNWTSYIPSATATIITIPNAGDKIFWRGYNPTGFGTSDGDRYAFVTTGSFNVQGSVMSLLDNGEGSATTIPCSYCFDGLFSQCNIVHCGNILPATTLAPYCYLNLFHSCASLVTPPKLPATTLAEGCYYNLVKNCTSLTDIPATYLPATTLANDCYESMFYGCTGLTSIPNGLLPATTVGVNSYRAMFYGCTNLTNAPDLPATNLAEACYAYMFYNCSALTTVPDILPATTVAVHSYWVMFHGCTSLTTAPALPATTLAEACYAYMFRDCTALTRIPSLPATNAVVNCYYGMFQGCSNLGFSTTRSSTYQHAFRCPSAGTLTAGTDWNKNMFYGTATASTIAAPTANTFYYSNKEVYPPIAEPFLCFTANQANSTVGIYKTGSPLASRVWYSTDGNTWSAMYGDRSYTLASVGSKFYMKGDNATGWSKDENNYWQIKTTGNVSVTGSVMALLDNAAGTMTTIPNNYCFFRLFIQDTGLTSVGNILTATTLKPYCYRDMFWCAPNLASVPADLLPAKTMVAGCYRGMLVGTKLTTIPNLPATTLADYCYAWMFDACSSLQSIPENYVLPAATLSTGCYSYLFQNCTNLTSVPAGLLPSTSLASYCYTDMFKNCPALTTTPNLPATTVYIQSYGGMFNGCIALQQAPALPAMTLGQGCYQYMFYNCTSLTRIPSLPATTTAAYCYQYMFADCSNLGFSTTKTGAYQHAFRCPSEGILTKTDYWNLDTFTGTATAGTIPRPTADTYYYSNTEVYPPIAEPNYLCFTANVDNCSIGIRQVGSPAAVSIEYSRDGGTWNTMSTVTDYTLVTAGSKFYVRGSNPSGLNKSAENYWKFYVSGNVSVTGSVMSLIDNIGLTTTIPCSFCFNALFASNTGITSIGNIFTATTLTAFCYRDIFNQCTNLASVPIDLLPVTNLVESCYSGMFLGTAITTPPVLPATSLPEGAYQWMFYGCTHLTSVPELPATDLGISCYYNMFMNCTGLTTVPSNLLPATTVPNFAYFEMFDGCTNLTNAPELPATTVGQSSYDQMFRYCSSLLQAPALPATNLAIFCYSYMFGDCTSLTRIPSLPATVTYNRCYLGMFNNCSNLGFSAAKTSTYSHAFRCPSSGTLTTAEDWNLDMFSGTATVGTIAAPDANVYYYSNTEVYPPIAEANYLCFTATAANSNLRLTQNGNPNVGEVYYCPEGGSWTRFHKDIDYPLTNVGDKIYLRANLSNGWNINADNYWNINVTGGVSITGSIMSLLDNGTNTATAIPSVACFCRLFEGSTGITHVGNILPATTLANDSYWCMFKSCTGLVSTDIVIPAATITPGCCYGMFWLCSALTTVPSDMLPATSIGNNGCDQMFRECTALTQAPALPATTLSAYCYSFMFGWCTSLTRIPSLPATVMYDHCYYGMFYSCNSLGFSLTKDSTYQHCFRCPSTGILTTATDWNIDMFSGTATAGTIPAPAADEYYYCNTDVYPDVPEANYLSFTATTTSTIGIATAGSPAARSTIYRIGTGAWQSYTPAASPTMISVPAGSTIYWRGVNPGGFSPSEVDFYFFKMTGSFTAAGSVMSLIDNRGTETTIPNAYCFQGIFAWCSSLTSVSSTLFPATNLKEGCYRCAFLSCTGLTNVPNLPATTLADKCYVQMFNGCTSLITVPSNLLHSTNLAIQCYNETFLGCTGLTSVPALPATTVTNYCYYQMFYGCTGLKTLPSDLLPATTATAYCYTGMFKNCTNLTNAPVLPATAVSTESYGGMFMGCTKLTTAPELPATTLGDGCYQYMFHGCTSLSSTPAILPATTVAYHCYWCMFHSCSKINSAPVLPAVVMAQNCYTDMFNSCTSLSYAPELPATTLAVGCYQGMFNGCAHLLRPVTLPATTIPDYAYYYMYAGCTRMRMSATQAGEYQVAYRIPAANTGTVGTNSLVSMFDGVTGSGTMPITPTVNTTYYAVQWSVTVYTYATTTVTLTKTGTPTGAGNFSYSTNGTSWTTWNPGTTVTLTGADQQMFIKANNPNGLNKDASNYYNIKILGNAYLKGNLMSLLDNGATAVVKDTIPNNYCFYGLFMGSTGLAYANRFEMPAVNLKPYCYASMFSGCTLLKVNLPSLPATVCQEGCYQYMYYGCTTITAACALPAQTLAKNCYKDMFCGCTALKTAPTLPATTLKSNCYYEMFYNCSALTAAPTLPATTLATSCYRGMFRGCTTITRVPDLPALVLGNNCYTRMFMQCTGLHMSATKTGVYQTVVRIPKTGTGTMGTDSMYYMFNGVGGSGTMPETPVINTKYYIE